MRDAIGPGDPIAVVHVSVSDQVAVNGRANARALLIFWDADRPVGQAETRFDEKGCINAAKLRSLVPPPRAVRELGPGGGAPTCSLVICTRDRPDDLSRCLASLFAQSRAPDEVIVVDNAPRDERTREVARAAGVRYVREDRPGLDIARNTGARAATGAIVAYTDDDVVLHPRWLERLTQAFDGARVMASTGLVLPAELETTAQQIFEHHWGFGRGFERIDFGPEFYCRTRAKGCPAWEIGAGASMAFRREVFAEVGFFDERLDAGAAGCSGDSEFWYRLLAAGWTCRYEPGAVAFHHHRRSMSALGVQIRAYMRGHVTALLVQFERTRERGNLRRICLSLPRYYARSLVDRLQSGRASGNVFLGEEVRGALSGLTYYFKARRALS